MNLVLLTHVVVSFLVGGSVITFISLLAEKSHEKISGIIMMFPSTIVLGFLFLGLATSARNLASVVPATLAPIGMVSFMAMVYIYFAGVFSKRFSSSLLQIVLSLLASSLVWLVMATPFAIFKFNNLVFGIVLYVVLAGTAHFGMNRKTQIERMPRVVYTPLQLVFRGVFVGCIIALVVLLGKTLGPFWGGVFTMYPAVTFASLSIFHYHYAPSQLVFFMKRAPLGSVLVLLYALSVMILYPEFGLLKGTIFSLCFSFVFSILLIKQQQKKLWKFLRKPNA